MPLQFPLFHKHRTAVILHRFCRWKPNSDEPEVEWYCLSCCYMAQKDICAIKCHLSVEIIISETSGKNNKRKENTREKKGNYGLLSN